MRGLCAGGNGALTDKYFLKTLTAGFQPENVNSNLNARQAAAEKNTKFSRSSHIVGGPLKFSLHALTEGAGCG